MTEEDFSKKRLQQLDDRPVLYWVLILAGVAANWFGGFIRFHGRYFGFFAACRDYECGARSNLRSNFGCARQEELEIFTTVVLLCFAGGSWILLHRFTLIKTSRQGT